MNEAVLSILEHLESELPISSDDGKSRIDASDRRFSLGITKRNRRHMIAYLVEKVDSAAWRKADIIRSKYKGWVTVEVTGQASSSQPAKVAATKNKRLEPGISVGHHVGYAGTLGAFVKGTEWVGFISASHVLSRINRAKKGDAILQPGWPDGPRALDRRVGTLENFIYLNHYQQEDSDPRNLIDVAVARLDVDEKTLEPPSICNLVPNPKNAQKRIQLKECVPFEEIAQQLGETVYKIGRSSGLTSGILDVVQVKPLAIRLTDGKVYFFENIAVVKSDGKKAFSEAGDSGSVVYTSEGRALGMVIGGSTTHTYLSILETCLSDLSVELL